MKVTAAVVRNVIQIVAVAAASAGFLPHQCAEVADPQAAQIGGLIATIGTFVWAMVDASLHQQRKEELSGTVSDPSGKV